MGRVGARMLAAALLVGGGWTALRGMTAAADGEEMAGSRQDSQEYRGTTAGLTVAFQYPSGWRLREETGTVETYAEVLIQGPRNDEDTYSPSLSVLAAPMTAEGKHRSAAALLGHYTGHLFPGASILDQSTRTVGGIQARDVMVSYVIPPLHQRGLKPLEIPVKSRTVILQRDPYLYQLTYSADAREYDRHVQEFERLLQTFRFQ